MSKYTPIKSKSLFHNWLEEQPGKLKLPDLNLLIEVFITEQNDDDVTSLVAGLLGESPQITSFLNEAMYHRRQLGISSKPAESYSQSIPPTKAQSLPQSFQSNPPSNTDNNKKPANIDNAPSFSQIDRDIHLYEPAALTSQPQNVSSFLSKAGGRNNTKNNPPQPNTSFKHALSHDSRVFFTEDDSDVLNIAQLRTLDVKQLSSNQNVFTKKDESMFPTLTANPNISNLYDSASQPQSINENPKKGKSGSNKDKGQDITHEFTSDPRFNFQDKRKKKIPATTPESPNIDTSVTKKTRPSEGTAQQGNEIIIHESRNVFNRTKCDCMCTEHPFYANCHDCGRIVCWLEGEGDCFYCGSYIINYDINREMIARFGASSNHKDSKSDKKDAKSDKNLKSEKTAKSALYNLRDLNVKGNGIICIKNELFGEQMLQLSTTNARGYYMRNPRKIKAQADPNAPETSPAHSGDNESIAIRTQSAYGQFITSGTDQTDFEREQAGLQGALKFRDTLIQREKEKAKRTKVIDEQADYYEYTNNIWLSQEEKEKQSKVAGKIDALVEDQSTKVSYSFEYDEKTKKMKQVALNTGYSQNHPNGDAIDVSMFQTGGVVGGKITELMETMTAQVEKEEERDNLRYADSGTATTVIGTGRVISLKEQQQRREFLVQKRRIALADLEKQQQAKEELLEKEKVMSSRGKKTRVVEVDPTSQHLSGKALAVFKTMQSTLNGEDDQNSSHLATSKRSTWADRLQQCDDLYELEYEYYTANPEKYMQDGYDFAIDDGPAGVGGIVDNNTDFGGCRL